MILLGYSTGGTLRPELARAAEPPVRPFVVLVGGPLPGAAGGWTAGADVEPLRWTSEMADEAAGSRAMIVGERAVMAGGEP